MAETTSTRTPLRSAHTTDMHTGPQGTYSIAVRKWSAEDQIGEAIRYELMGLGHQSICLNPGAIVPESIDVVFSFAPFGELLPLLHQWDDIPPGDRPTIVHWNTEGLPDLRIPWGLVRAIGAMRSWISRLSNSDDHGASMLIRKLSPLWRSRMMRFRYVGDYYYAHRRKWLDVFGDSSAIYAQLHDEHGLPTVVAPWGATPSWYADLNLDRDIDVLWIGKRATRRRSRLLDRVRKELRARGIEVYVADNVENPFIFGEERTRFLNRAKITLNLTRTWYDDNFSRFAMAAPNRSLIVSEPLLPHCPQYKAGTHYVSAPIEELADSIAFYVEHEDERQAIVERAYQLVTTELTLRNSMARLIRAVRKHRLHAAER